MNLKSLSIVAIIVLTTLTGCKKKASDQFSFEDYGTLSDGTSINLCTLINDNGMIAKITNYGGIVTELYVPDRNGKMADVG